MIEGLIGTALLFGTTVWFLIRAIRYENKFIRMERRCESEAAAYHRRGEEIDALDDKLLRAWQATMDAKRQQYCLERRIEAAEKALKG